MAVHGVVMVSPNFHPYVGGAEKQAFELSKRLLTMGVRVKVLTRRKGELPAREIVAGVDIVRLPAWGWGLLDSSMFMAGVFAWLVRNVRDYDAVHVHLAGSPAVSSALAGRLLGRLVFVKLGGGRGIGELAASKKSFAGRIKLRLLAMLKPRFVAVTRDLVEELAAHGLRRAPVVVVPNGVDTHRYHPVTPAEKDALRRSFGWPAGLCFLYVGRLSSEKRLDAFLDTFALALKDTGAQAFLALIGAGPEEARLKTRVRSAGLESQVWFHAATADVAGAYSAADVFVLPSVSEGLSNSLLEAMASGCAVLASRVGGTKDAVVDGETGLLFEPLDAEQLKEHLTKFLRAPDLARALGRSGREAAVARFDLDTVAKQYMELYGFKESPVAHH